MPEPQGRISFWGVEVFLAIAEEGSISAAARRLGVSPPAISQQISALEAQLGSTLFDRSTRPLVPTPAGHLFRRHAQTILNAEAEARSDLAQSHLSRLTTLRLGVIEDFDAVVTPSLLTNLAASMPQTRFLLETGPSHRLLDQLESRALDLVVAAEMGVETADVGWREVHPLLFDPFVAVRPNQAREVPLILYSQRYLMGRQIAAHLARSNQRPEVRFELDSYNAILELVAKGEGWAILTPLALHHGQRFLGDVRVERLDLPPLARTVSLSARAGVMGALPLSIAQALQDKIAETIVAPAHARWPWLAEDLRLV